MTNDSFFATMITSLIAMFFGFVVAFGGYRFFLILLPIWGFFFGFGFGAHSLQALLGDGFLVTITSWVIGLCLWRALCGVVVPVLPVWCSVARRLAGLRAGCGLLLAIGVDYGFLPWLIGVVVGAVFVVGAFVLNLQKWIIIIATSVLGAGIIVGTFLFMFGGLPSPQLVQNPVRAVLQTSPLWLIVFIVFAVLGGIAQYQTTRRFEAETYDRFAEMTNAPTTTI